MIRSESWQIYRFSSCKKNIKWVKHSHTRTPLTAVLLTCSPADTSAACCCLGSACGRLTRGPWRRIKGTGRVLYPSQCIYSYSCPCLRCHLPLQSSILLACLQEKWRGVKWMCGWALYIFCTGIHTYMWLPDSPGNRHWPFGFIQMAPPMWKRL